jgi:hypothetical protein
MAITITKEPSGIYPAYNDSFIEFSSDLANNNKAEITVYPLLTFPKVFTIYPDANGKYLFNLKEAVKVIFNAPGFKDANFDTSVYWKSISGLYLSQDIDIEVFSDIDSESTSETYEFFKAVKQVGEPLPDNPFQLLSFTEDGWNHYLTYFEGFPFHWDIQRIATGKDMTVKSLNTGNETAAMETTLTDSFRMIVDKSNGDNWTSDNVLPLITGLNRLEIYEDAVFKSNVFLTKRKKCSGVYLKWFNASGGFSHFLFDRYFNDRTRAKNIDMISNTEFNNIGSSTGNFKSTGKEAERSLTLKTKYDSNEYNILKDILISPLVQIYTSRFANVEGTFIDVNIDGSLNFSNKKGLNTAVFSVDMPDVITAKL